MVKFKILFNLFIKTIIIAIILFALWLFISIFLFFYTKPKIIKGLEINGVNYTLIKNKTSGERLCKIKCYEVVYCFDKNNGICTQDVSHSPAGSLIKADKILNIYEKDNILYIVVPKSEKLDNDLIKDNIDFKIDLKFRSYDVRAVIEYV